MREARRVLVAYAVLVTALFALVRPTAPPAANSAARVVLQELNRARADQGLRPLRADAPLTRAARWHSQDLLRRNAFEHGDFYARLRRFKARGPLFGENLAWGGGGLGSPGALVEAWLKSPGHRANLLRPGWRRVGIGLATGRFQGYGGVTLLTADFAGR